MVNVYSKRAFIEDALRLLIASSAFFFETQPPDAPLKMLLKKNPYISVLCLHPFLDIIYIK